MDDNKKEVIMYAITAIVFVINLLVLLLMYYV